MSISHGATTRAEMCEAAVRPIDGGAGVGKLKFLTAGSVTLCTVLLSKPAFGLPSGASQSALGMPRSGTVSQGGTITQFYVTDSADNTIIAGTVGTSGADINLSSTAVSINDVIQVDGITYTAAV